MITNEMGNMWERLEQRQKNARAFIQEAERRGDDSWGGTSVEYWRGVVETISTVLNMKDEEGKR